MIKPSYDNIRLMLAFLGDRTWRIDNLGYKIIDDRSRLIDFKMNPVQRALHENLHTRNVIVKARQEGLSTYIQIYILDDSIHTNFGTSAIMAQDLPTSRKIFSNKIKLAYEHLPPFILNQLKVDVTNNDELIFDHARNGESPIYSKIYCCVSPRGDTLRNAHLSEYGELWQQYPVKGAEVKSGTFPTLHEDSICFIESTAHSPIGDFYDKYKAAAGHMQSGEPLTRMDWRLFFFGWYHDRKYQLQPPVGYEFSEEMALYFTGIEDSQGIKLTVPQKYWYVKAKAEQRGNMTSQYPSTPEEAFQTIVAGAIFKDELERMSREERLKKWMPYDESLPVHTAWDLGEGEGHATAIAFFQWDGFHCRYIDWYYSELGGLPKAIKYVKGKDYLYGKHFGPHDLAKTDMSSTNRDGLKGKDRQQIARELGLQFTKLKRPAVKYDHIEVGRLHLSRSIFDTTATGDVRDEETDTTIPGLYTCLANYQYDKNERLGRYGRAPLHNWASNGADAFLYSAQAIPLCTTKHKRNDPDLRKRSEPKQSMVI